MPIPAVPRIRSWRRSLAPTAALAAMLLTRCAGAAQSTAFIAATDYVTGALAAIDLDTRAVSTDVASIHSDATLRWFGGLLYVVNRYGQDNIQVIDPAQNYATIRQFSTGNGSNPQDIAFVSPTKAYVSRYASADLLIVDPSDPNGNPQSTLSLGAFADGDGIPEMARMIRVERWLFVACQRLTNFAPSNPSFVVVVDTQTDTVLDVDPSQPGIQAIPLVGRNPTTAFAFDRQGTRLLIGCAGAFGALDGGIELLDPVSFESLGYAITEAALGGDVGDVAWKSASHSYALVSGSSSSELVSWNPQNGTKIGTPYSVSTGFSLPDCELNDRGELYLCDASFTAPGVLIFSTANDALIAGPLDTDLPPNQVTFDGESNLITGVPRSSSETLLSVPWPNPARDAARLALTLAQGAFVRVEILDLSGRRVRRLAEGQWPAGRTEMTWDLSDDRGRPQAPGLYWVRAQVGAAAASRSFVVLR